MLPVIEYFAKSLKITQGHSKWHYWEGRKTWYWLATVNIALACTIFDLACLMLNNIVTLKPRSLELHGTIRKLACSFHSPSIVTMALSCITSKIKRDGRKSRFFNTSPAFDDRVSKLTRDIDIAVLSVRPSVCPSVFLFVTFRYFMETA